MSKAAGLRLPTRADDSPTESPVTDFAGESMNDAAEPSAADAHGER